MVTYELWSLKSRWRTSPQKLLERLRAEPGTLLEDVGVPVELHVEQIPELVEAELKADEGAELDDTAVQEQIAELADEIRKTVERSSIWISPSWRHAVTRALPDG